jgi:hypothetical protein
LEFECVGGRRFVFGGGEVVFGGAWFFEWGAVIAVVVAVVVVHFAATSLLGSFIVGIGQVSGGRCGRFGV